MAEIADPLIIRLKPNQNPVARDFLKLALSIAGGAAVILALILREILPNHSSLAALRGELVAVDSYRDFLFDMYVNARSDPQTLILTNEGFLDTRMLDALVSWKDVRSIERCSSHFSPEGVFLDLINPCSFKAGFLDTVIAKFLFGKFGDKQRIFVSFSRLDFDSDKLADIFATKSAHAIEPAQTGGGYGGL